MIATHPNPDAEAQRIRDEFERYEIALYLDVQHGRITQPEADRLLCDRAWKDTYRIWVELGERP